MPADLQEELAVLSGVRKLAVRRPAKWKPTEDEWPRVEGQVLGSFLPLLSDELNSFELLEAVLVKKPYIGNLKKVWRTTLRRAGVPHFTLYELRHTFATRLSAGGVSDHFVTQMLRQGDAQVFKRYSQAKLMMMREALARLDRNANEHPRLSGTVYPQ